MHSDLGFIEKLQEFIRKYHTNEIVRGGILFLSIGLFTFLLFLLLEYLLWLPPAGRMFLFWGYLTLVAFFFYKFLLIPFFKLVHLKKGLSYEKAARIIGDFFPEISDKVLNTLELGLMEEESELLLASVAQKTQEMQSFSFPHAVSYLSNKKYLVYFLVPILLFVLSFLVADTNWFGSTYKRVTNYNTTYTPPAAYSFRILNDSLSVVQGADFNLSFVVEGKRIPEEVRLLYNNESYSLPQAKDGSYNFEFLSTSNDILFSIIGNDQVQENFVLNVLLKPFIENITLIVEPPKHTYLSTSSIHGSGSIQVPEGSIISWQIETKQADVLQMHAMDSLFNFSSSANLFTFKQTILSNFDYTLEAFNIKSNQNEQLDYKIEVLKDSYPSITIQSDQDAISSSFYSFSGIAEDDYGLSSLNFTVFPTDDSSSKQTFNIPISGLAFEAFHFTFDTTSLLKTSGSYTYYFEVTDNDLVHGYKTTRSNFGFIHALSSDALKDSHLDFQLESLDKLSNSIQEWKNENLDLEDLADLERNAKEVLWEDFQKAKAFAKQESSALEHLKTLTHELQRSLETMQASDSSSSEKEYLQQRMQEQLNNLKRNQDVLDKLEAYQAKISNEKLQKEVEEYKQQKKIQEKNLGQLLELTKRFYVAEKNTKLASDLMLLGDKQIKLSQHTGVDLVKEQLELQHTFDSFQKELDALQKENQKLLRPFNLYQDKATERRIATDQQDALDKLNENAFDATKSSQKGAGQKMQDLATQMKQHQENQKQEASAEDTNVLRQILDNLLRFSFSQEEVLDIFKASSFNNPKFGSYLTNQFDLKTNFRHIHDSLFALSLRQPSFGKEVHTYATQVDHHIDAALDNLAQNRLSVGNSHQHYALTNANELAALLSDILDNMQMSMGSSSGESKDPQSQLSDIIEKQKSLIEGENNADPEGDSETLNDEGLDKDPSSDTKGDGNDQPDKLSQESYSDKEGESYYDIYKEQQLLKFQLENYLKMHGTDALHSTGILEEMDALSLRLLEDGTNDSNRRQMQRILHKLLELNKANLQQQEDENRQSSLDFSEFKGSTNSLKLTPKSQLPIIEQLNKESLHLTPYYRQKVKQYFKP